MNILVILSIFLIPLASIVPIAGTIVWYPQLLVLLFIGLIALSFRFWKLNKFISLLLMYESFSYIFITQQNPRTMLCLLCAFASMALAYEVSKLKNTRIIYGCIIGMAIFQSLYVVMQFLGIDFFFHGISSKTDVVGFVGSHNQLGVYYSAVGLILAALNPFLIIFSLVPIFLAKQNGAMLGLASGIIFYAWLSYSKTLAVSLLILIALLSFFWLQHCGKSHQELSERLDLWKQTIEQSISGKTLVDLAPIKQYESKAHKSNLRLIQANPLFGYGLGNFFSYSPLSQYSFLTRPDQGHRYEHAHNDLIEGLYELGAFGFILLLLIISEVISSFISVVDKTEELILTFCSLIAVSVSSLSIYVFHAPVSLFMFAILLGLFYKEVNSAKAKINGYC